MSKPTQKTDFLIADFVTVASFETAPLAWLHRNQLAENGVTAIVTDEYVTCMNWMYSNAIGGVKVQVPRTELRAYLRIAGISTFLDAQVFPADDEMTSEKCPTCGSHELSATKWHRQTILLVWAISGILVPMYSPEAGCGECGFSRRSWLRLPKHFRMAHLVLLLPIVVLLVIFQFYFGPGWSSSLLHSCWP